MKVFKWLSLMAAIFAVTIVIVKQYEEISNQENMLTLQRMEIYMLKSQVNLLESSIIMGKLDFYENAISSKMGENKPIR